MKKLFKIAAVSALTLMSVNAFAASQQAQDVKKFSEWEEVTRDKVNVATDAIVQAMGTNDVAKTEAAIAEFDKKSAEYLAELDALGIQSAEATPLIGLYKDYIEAEKATNQVYLSQAKSPSIDNMNKISDAQNKAKEKESLYDKLVDELEAKFPEE